MKDLKTMIVEYIGVGAWATNSSWTTAGIDANIFKKLAVGLCDNNMDKVKDAASNFFKELEKNTDTKLITRRVGENPKGKFAIGINIGDDEVSLLLKLDKKLKVVGKDQRACSKGWGPFSDWAPRRSAVNSWGSYECFFIIDESSHLVDEMEEFAYNSGIMQDWIKSF